MTCIHAQPVPGIEAKNWYFGVGTDGIVFDVNNIPYKVSNKMGGVGYEGNVTVNDPLSGSLLFYSDGQTVVNSNHVAMFNGTGLYGHMSGAQTVQCVPMPGQPGKFYLLTSRAWDFGGDNLFYSVVDFTDINYPLGKVTNKNTLVSAALYGQANKVISKPNTQDYWWIGHVMNTNTYHIIAITAGGFSAPVTYTATGTNAGQSYAMTHHPLNNKVAVSGLGTLGLILMDFNSTTGVLSNPTQLFSVAAGLGNFSPNGSKLYFLMNAGGYKLHQYDLSNGVTTNMNTCCYAHDTKTGPDGRMYHIHTYSNTNPIAVINNPDLSAVGNACGYSASAGIAGVFNGEVRRFPEFVVLPLIPPLGMEFVQFSAEKQSGKVRLEWEMSEGCSGCSFEVERGNGHGTYRAIGNVDFEGLIYEYDDHTAGNESWFYRIKLIDATGKMMYSSVERVHAAADGKLHFQVFPNPCQEELNVVSDDPDVDLVKIEVMDMAGKRLFSKTIAESSFKVDVSALAKGVYVLKTNVNGQVAFNKFEKL
jgi:hypothetical protein